MSGIDNVGGSGSASPVEQEGQANRTNRKGKATQGNPSAASGKTKPDTVEQRVTRARELETSGGRSFEKAQTEWLNVLAATENLSTNYTVSSHAAFSAALRKCKASNVKAEGNFTQALACLEGWKANFSPPGMPASVGQLRERIDRVMQDIKYHSLMGQALTDYASAHKYQHALDETRSAISEEPMAAAATGLAGNTIASFELAFNRMQKAIEVGQNQKNNTWQSKILHDTALKSLHSQMKAMWDKGDQISNRRLEIDMAILKLRRTDEAERATRTASVIALLLQLIKPSAALLKAIDNIVVTSEKLQRISIRTPLCKEDEFRAKATRQQAKILHYNVLLTRLVASQIPSLKRDTRSHIHWLDANTSKWTTVLHACLDAQQKPEPGPVVAEVMKHLLEKFDELHTYYRFHALNYGPEAGEAGTEAAKCMRRVVQTSNELMRRLQAEAGAILAAQTDTAVPDAHQKIEEFIVEHTPPYIARQLADTSIVDPDELLADIEALEPASVPTEPVEQPVPKSNAQERMADRESRAEARIAELEEEAAKLTKSTDRHQAADERPQACDCLRAAARLKMEAAERSLAVADHWDTAGKPEKGDDWRSRSNAYHQQATALTAQAATQRQLHNTATIETAIERLKAEAGSNLSLARIAQKNNTGSPHDVYHLTMRAVECDEKCVAALHSAADKWDKLSVRHTPIDPLWATKAQALRQRATTLAEKADNERTAAGKTRTEMVKLQAPSAGGLRYLREHNEIARVDQGERRPSSDDFVEEFLIFAKPLEPNGQLVSWGSAHVHFDRMNDSLEKATTHHFKKPHERMDGPQERARQAAQGIQLDTWYKTVHKDVIADLKALRDEHHQ